ncbi:flavodoxin family protein [Clostridium beijerinckii]|nr:flavodoxin family protein [Clostridium beijerinckii]AWK52985.1 flavodoxin family protein [Clostridium beijerinckii]
MKVIAINGSPRKNGNTVTLLQKALEGAKSMGADTEIVHLYDLNFKGCTSCFACKRKGSKYNGHCAMKDDLTSILENILKCDVLLLGSPLYFNSVTGEMRSFLERLLFSIYTYNTANPTFFKGKVDVAVIYTMNATAENIKQSNMEESIFDHLKNLLKLLLNGTSEFLLSTDNYQFNDYSKYESSIFDEKHKAQVKIEQFPIDCQKSFDIGARLAVHI